MNPYVPQPGLEVRASADRTARRRTARLVVLWTVLPLMIALALFGLNLGTLDLRAHNGISQADHGDFNGSQITFELIDGMDPVEQWRADYDIGTAALQNEDLWTAYQAFGRALEEVPEEYRCQVQINYSLLLEVYADAEMEESARYRDWAEQAQQYVDQGKSYPETAEWGQETPAQLNQEAIDWAGTAASDYSYARQLREECSDSDTPAPQDSSADERLKDKQEQAEQDAGMDDSQQDDSDGDLSPEEAEAQRQEELNGRNEDAANEADTGRQEDNGGSDGSGGGANANW